MVAWVTKALDKVRRRTLDQVGGGDRNAAVAPGGTPAGSAFAGSAGRRLRFRYRRSWFRYRAGPAGCVGLDFDVVLVAPERLGLEAGSRDSAAAWRRIKADRSASVRNQKRPVPAPAPVRRFLPELIEKIWTRGRSNLGKGST